MDDWVQIISNQWFITLSTHEITWFFFELKELWKVYYVISCYWYRVQHTYVRIMWAHVFKIFMDMMKISPKLYYYVHYLISNYLPRDQQCTMIRVIKTTVFIYTNVLFYLHLNPYISDISNIYNTDEILSLAYQTIYEHMFTDPELYHNFHVFWLHTWIIYFFFWYVEIFHLLKRWEGAGIHCKLIPDWIESTPSRILFTVNTEQNSK